MSFSGTDKNKDKRTIEDLDQFMNQRIAEVASGNTAKSSESDGKESTGITPAMLASFLKTGSVRSGSSDAIVASEKAGQAAVVSGDFLPTKGLDKDKLEKIGFVIGQQKDDLFTYATLPVGWSKKGSGHDMWSYLYDEAGRERASIFYKAAFYDRSAYVSFKNRYSTTSGAGAYPTQDDYDSNIKWYGVIDNQTDTVLFHLDDIQPLESGQRDYKRQDSDYKLAQDWLKQNYPEFNDYTAYWGK